MARLIKCFTNCALGALVTLFTISTALPDDIDAYVGAPPAATPGDTLVVFTLDLRPNVLASQVCQNGECDALWNEVYGTTPTGSVTFFQMLVAALRKVLGDVTDTKLKVALMISHADTTGGNKQCIGYQNSTPSDPSKRCSNGGYVLSSFKQVTDSTQLQQFFDKLTAIPYKNSDGSPDNFQHPYQLEELFFEMYRYLVGGHIYNSENGWNDFGTDTTYNIDDNADTSPTTSADLSWDPNALIPNSKYYASPLTNADSCSRVFSINVTFANANQESNSDSAIAAAPPEGLGFDPSNSSAGETQVLSYLAGTDLDPSLAGDQKLLSFFVTRSSGGSGGGGAVNRANDWAQAGGTGSAIVVGDDPSDLVRKLKGLLNEIIGVSTTFVAASVPANVFNRAQTLNEVFLAIFQPNTSNLPFWVGNVKKLTTTDVPVTSCDSSGNCTVIGTRKILVDVLEANKPNPTSAINPLDGRIRPGALTYWTQTGTNDEYLPAPTTQDEASQYSLGTDGRKVDRGGAGQVKPGYLGSTNSPGETNALTKTTMDGPRTVFTEPDASTNGPADMVNLEVDSLSSTAISLLTDSRTYPASTDTYGDHLFQTVMSDCSTCPSSYASASSTQQAQAVLRVNNLIRYARGYDVSLDTPLTPEPGKRAWWEADPLHSRPLALNYGARTGYSATNPDIRVLVAGNDGMVQMIRDGRSSTGAEDGVEAWAFLPSEFVPLQKRLMEGSIGEYNPGFPSNTPLVPLHPYAMDGAPTALVIDNNLDGTIDASAGDKAYLFIGERRGGKRYYALDITDPDNPKFLWSIGKDDAGFGELGQTWSLMQAGVMQVNESGTIKHRPVLVIGGGYNGDDGGDDYGDLGKDSRVLNDPGPDGVFGGVPGTKDVCDILGVPTPCDNDGDDGTVGTADDEGNALFIVNALTGKLIWKAVNTSDSTLSGSYDPTSQSYRVYGLVDSVPASPAVLDSNGDGLIDRVYFVDTGGDVWRMDAGDADRADWKVTKLFNAGRHFKSDNADDRRFFDSPDVVLAKDNTGNFDAVVVASGDRANPLESNVQNWIYMIKDRATTSGSPSTTTLTHDDLLDLTNNCLQGQSLDSLDFSNCTDSNPTDAASKLANGWKVELEKCQAGGTGPNCGEKSLASPLTVQGTIFLTSYLPFLGSSSSSTPTTCSPEEGSGVFYALDLQTSGGTLDFNPDNNVGGVPVPDRSTTLHSPGIPPEVVAISPQEVLRPDLVVQKTKGTESGKTFWYERRY